jgi:hypothetical protein
MGAPGSEALTRVIDPGALFAAQITMKPSMPEAAWVDAFVARHTGRGVTEPRAQLVAKARQLWTLFGELQPNQATQEEFDAWPSRYSRSSAVVTVTATRSMGKAHPSEGGGRFEKQLARFRHLALREHAVARDDQCVKELKRALARANRP